MENYQLLPVIFAALALLAGMYAGIRVRRYSWASALSPYAFALVIAAFIFGGNAVVWLTGIIVPLTGSHLPAALISAALVSFASGILLALSGSSNNREQDSSQKENT
jgi:heme A synthase